MLNGKVVKLVSPLLGRLPGPLYIGRLGVLAFDQVRVIGAGDPQQLGQSFRRSTGESTLKHPRLHWNHICLAQNRFRKRLRQNWIEPGPVVDRHHTEQLKQVLAAHITAYLHGAQSRNSRSSRRFRHPDFMATPAHFPTHFLAHWS